MYALDLQRRIITKRIAEDVNKVLEPLRVDSNLLREVETCTHPFDAVRTYHWRTKRSVFRDFPPHADPSHCSPRKGALGWKHRVTSHRPEKHESFHRSGQSTFPRETQVKSALVPIGHIHEGVENDE